MSAKILFVATSHDQLGDTGTKTGCWVEEVAAPYFVFKNAGYEVVIASIKGGTIPFDEASLSGDFFTPAAQRFQKEHSDLIENTPSVLKVLSDGIDHFDAIFLPGGHGIVFDGPDSAGLQKVLETMAAQGKVISAVCHGPGALTSALGPDGNPIVYGKSVTGFSNEEEEAVGKTNAVPFLLEDKLKELGGKYSSGPQWSEHVTVDGKLVLGQNPQSSEGVGKAVVTVLTPLLKI